MSENQIYALAEFLHMRQYEQQLEDGTHDSIIEVGMEAQELLDDGYRLELVNPAAIQFIPVPLQQVEVGQEFLIRETDLDTGEVLDTFTLHSKVGMSPDGNAQLFDSSGAYETTMEPTDTVYILSETIGSK